MSLDSKEKKLPYNKTQALPQKLGILFMQENFCAKFMDIHWSEISAYNVHDMLVDCYFLHIMCLF